MKRKFTSLLLSVLLLVSLLGGCMTAPETDAVYIPETLSAVAETVAAAEETAAPEEDDLSVSQTDIVDAAYALSEKEYLEGEQQLTGTVTRIVTAYNSKYDNVSVEMAVEGREDRPILCFRLEGTGVEDLQPGDEITVAGQLTNYNGTIEFDAGCVLEYFVQAETPVAEESAFIIEDGDDSAESVAAYIHAYGCLPNFYMTKNEARDLFGWEGGALDNVAPGRAIGGDRFGNYEGQLPEAKGRYYTECDIGTIGNGSRGAKRIVFSNDGLIFYTEDHYETFELLYGEPRYEGNYHQLPGICAPLRSA